MFLHGAYRVYGTHGLFCFCVQGMWYTEFSRTYRVYGIHGMFVRKSLVLLYILVCYWRKHSV